MQACSYLMSSWATDLPEKISVLQTCHQSSGGKELARALRPGEGTNHPSTGLEGEREAWGDHTKLLPILCSKEKKGEGREGHPQHPDTLQAPCGPARQLSPGDRNSGLLAGAHGDPTLQVMELA